MSPQSRKFKKTLALTLAVGALAPAGASAMLPPPDQTVRSNADVSSQPYVLQGGHDVGITSQQPAPASPAIVEVDSSSGFDWGDAGIGAAGAVGLTALAMGGILIARRHGRGPTGAVS